MTWIFSTYNTTTFLGTIMVTFLGTIMVSTWAAAMRLMLFIESEKGLFSETLSAVTIRTVLDVYSWKKN